MPSYRYRDHIRDLVIIFLAVLIVYGAALTNGFVWDDHAIVQGRNVYRTFDLRAMFLSLGNDLEYLPLRDISYAIDYKIWGEHSAAGFHASNVLIYFLSMFFVYFVSLEVIRLLRPETLPTLLCRVSLLVTLFYALHPIQVQAVSFVTCRNVLLSGLFFYAACYLYLRSWKHNSCISVPFYGGALICFLLALMSKATVIIFPLMLCGIEWFRLSGLRKKVERTAPFFIISLVFYFVFSWVAIKSQIIRATTTNSATELWGEKIAIAGQIPWFYIKKLIIPFGFAAEYEDFFSRNITDGMVIFSICGVIAVILLVWKLGSSYPHLLFGVFWFFVTLLPVLNFFSTNPIVADRYAYLPGYGFCLILGATIVLRSGNSILPRYLAIICICIMSIISFQMVQVWKSDISLWESNIKTAPGQIKAYTNLGWAYFYNKDYAKALEVFRQERAINPDSINYDLAQGYRHFLDHNYQAAIKEFQLALQKKQDALYPLYLLARSYMIIGDQEGASMALKRILLSREIDFSDYRSKAQSMLERMQKENKQQSN
jgi:hypothetical protein